MYSGTTLTKASGRIIGAHQKIDKLAYRQLAYFQSYNDSYFPSISQILHFEGANGPDGIKRKSPAKDEPWHYFQPYDLKDKQLLDIIDSHFKRLVESLKQHDQVRSSFEAAWLAHAMVDGLTPAHQFPYEQKLIELRGGSSIANRTTIKDKLLQPGTTISQILVNNWKFWGPKGLFMTHAAFEMGIATMIKPISYRHPLYQDNDYLLVTDKNIKTWYRSLAQQVHDMHLYDAFYEHGWNRKLAKQVKKELLPILVMSVTLSWQGAIYQANK